MNRYFLISAIASNLAIAGDAVNPHGTLLARAGARVEQFWNDFSSVTCTEQVLQSKFAPTGKTILERKSLYDYIVIMTWTGDELNVSETRTPQGKPPREAERPLLITQGFAALLLIFHPNFQSSYEFTELPPETINGRSLHRLRFRHREGQRSLSALQLRSRDFPIEWEGVAWIDAETAIVLRLQTALKSPMNDLGLKYLTSDVSYAPVRLNGEPQPLYLPEQAVIEAKTAKQHWKNTHRFLKYRIFTVDTTVKIEEPPPSK